MIEAPQADLLHDMSVTSFGGVSCAQTWADFIVWEAILNSEHRRGLKRIVELGTWTGGFSLYLYAQATARQMGFLTMDSVLPADLGLSVPKWIPGFVRCDIWKMKDELRLSLGHGGEPIVLFCDNGNKPRELKEFAGAVSPGSLVAVHDWGTEVGPDDVPDFLVPIHEEYLDSMGSITRWFERP